MDPSACCAGEHRNGDQSDDEDMTFFPTVMIEDERVAGSRFEN